MVRSWQKNKTVVKIEERLFVQVSHWKQQQQRNVQKTQRQRQSSTTVLTVASFSSSTIILEGSSSTCFALAAAAALQASLRSFWTCTPAAAATHCQRSTNAFCSNFSRRRRSRVSQGEKKKKRKTFFFALAHTLRENGLAKPSSSKRICQTAAQAIEF